MAISSIRATSLFAVASLAAGIAAQGPAADVYVPGSKPVVAPVQGPTTPGVRIQAANVIYDNGPIVTLPGGSVSGRDLSQLQNVTLGDTTFGASANNAGLGGFNLADDFTVPPGQMWYVESVEVYGYRTGSNPVIAYTDGVVQVLDSDPLAGPANVVFGDLVTNRLAVSGDTNASRVVETATDDNRRVAAVTLTVGKLFKPGQYWLVYGLNTNAATGATFVPPVTISGSTNTGDGRQLDVTLGTWTATVHGISLNPYGIPFKLCGEVACCFENDMGAALAPNGDDFLYNIPVVPSFAMPGGLGNTTSIDVCTNGYVFLQGGGGADFSPEVADLLSQQARICVPWNDFNSGTGGNVRIRTTALRTIVTWDRIATFGVIGSQSIAQLQMFPNGTFTINSWTITQGPSSWNTPIFGVSPGNGAADPGETDFSAGPVSTATGTVYELFSNSTGADLYDLNGLLFCFDPNAAGGYDVSSQAGCCQLASNSLVGPGCFGFTTNVVSNAIAGGTAHLASTLPVGTIGQVTLVGGIATPFGLDLSIIFAPSCFLHHSNDLFSIPMDGAGNSFLPLPCLSFLLGFPIQTQGVAIAPGVNVGGIATGDAHALVIGNL